MKKTTFWAALFAAGLSAACTGNKDGYVVTGTVEGANEGDTVLLQKVDGRELIPVDTAVITNGKFSFEGTQVGTEVRYLSCNVNGERLMMDFFLEKGKIDVAVARFKDSATGTATNDIFQGVRAQSNELMKTRMDIIAKLQSDTTLTAEGQQQLVDQMGELENKFKTLMKESTKANITNPVGVLLFKQSFYENTTEENAELLAQIPASLMTDERLVQIKELTEKQQKTAVGTKYTDFTMQTPEGNPVKLSDFVGKNKVVLVDFWASWCGPCRHEMPRLVEAYAKYKAKGLEIVGVSLDENAESWKDAIKALNITWPQMSDLKGWACEGAQMYAVNAIPHVMLIDAEGTIISRGLHGDELQAKLAELFQ